LPFPPELRVAVVIGGNTLDHCIGSQVNQENRELDDAVS
jgi:hypothetical protein